MGRGLRREVTDTHNILADMNADGKADFVLSEDPGGLTAPTVVLISQSAHYSW